MGENTKQPIPENEKKPIWKRWWFWGIIIIVLIVALGGDSKKVEPTAQLDVTALEITDYAKYLIKETVGEETNNKKQSLKEITSPSPDKIILDLNASDSFTKKTTRQSMLIKSPEIFSKAFTDRPELTYIMINWYLDLVDVRGNEKVGEVMIITFTKENANTINWEKIDPENIPLVADHYWEHPLFSRE